MSIILFSKKFSEKAEEIKLAAINALKEVEINTSFSEEQKGVSICNRYRI